MTKGNVPWQSRVFQKGTENRVMRLDGSAVEARMNLLCRVTLGKLSGKPSNRERAGRSPLKLEYKKDCCMRPRTLEICWAVITFCCRLLAYFACLGFPIESTMRMCIIRLPGFKGQGLTRWQPSLAKVETISDHFRFGNVFAWLH